MNTTDSIFQRALGTILAEVFEGSPHTGYVLNPGDSGMLKQLDGIDAKAASTRSIPGQTTVAAHVDHVHFGLSILNRWAAGEENPFATADWNGSWKRGEVNDEQWATLRSNLRSEWQKWQAAVAARTDWDDIAAAGSLSSAAHTAYHLGAIRQILAAMNLHHG